LLAAYATPPHPTAIASTAAISLRQERRVAELDLWSCDNAAAIGEVVKRRSNSWR